LLHSSPATRRNRRRGE